MRPRLGACLITWRTPPSPDRRSLERADLERRDAHLAQLRADDAAVEPEQVGAPDRAERVRGGEQRVRVVAEPAQPVEVALVAGPLLARAGAARLTALGDALAAARVVGADVEHAVEAAEGGGHVGRGGGQLLRGGAEVALEGLLARANGRTWVARIGAASRGERAHRGVGLVELARTARRSDSNVGRMLLGEAVDLGERQLGLAQRAGQPGDRGREVARPRRRTRRARARTRAPGA